MLEKKKRKKKKKIKERYKKEKKIFVNININKNITGITHKTGMSRDAIFLAQGSAGSCGFSGEKSTKKNI